MDHKVHRNLRVHRVYRVHRVAGRHRVHLLGRPAGSSLRTFHAFSGLGFRV